MAVSAFPHPNLASSEGLLAIGGDLSVETLITAYHFGIYPWYSEGQDIMWWCPDPRCILLPSEIKVSKSMRSLLRKKPYEVSADRAFKSVILHCQNICRQGQDGTWITDEMVNAYMELHKQGFAHSIEVWEDSRLIGGLYGLSLGKVFFGESMFALEPNASKYGFILLVKKLEEMQYEIIDCQQDTPHLRSLGAKLMARDEFLHILKNNRLQKEGQSLWNHMQFLPRH